MEAGSRRLRADRSASPHSCLGTRGPELVLMRRYRSSSDQAGDADEATDDARGPRRYRRVEARRSVGRKRAERANRTGGMR